jgi:hypothetical protein
VVEFSAPTKSRVSPKRSLAERLLRSVAARSLATEAPVSAFRCVQLRPVGMRCVDAKPPGPLSDGLTPKPSLPRSFASRREAPGAALRGLAAGLKQAASAKVFQRMAKRLAASGPGSEFSSERRELRQFGPVASRLH